jgi:hypothetical protein
MYVGITGNVVGMTHSIIHRMKQQELSSLTVPGGLMATGNEPWLAELIWGQHLPLVSQIPKDWTVEVSKVRISKVVYKGHEFLNLNLEIARKVPSPPNNNQYYGAAALGKFDPEWFKDWFEYLIQHKEIEARWDQVEEQVMKFLNNCKSLNEALKLWPQVEIYVPKEYVAKVREKREVVKTESNAAEVLKSIDTDQLTAAAVMARMSQPKGE